MRLTVIFFMIIFSFVHLAAQEFEIGFDDHNRHLQLKQELLNSPGKDNAEQDFKMRKSPVRAMLYSTVLPGAGQFYNESYWKIPVIAALGGYFGYGIINNNNKANDYGEQYRNSQTPLNPNGDLQLKGLRDFYNDQRDRFIIYASILYIANVVDAYVDAHLYDFDVSEKKNLNIKAGFSRMEISFSF